MMAITQRLMEQKYDIQEDENMDDYGSSYDSTTSKDGNSANGDQRRCFSLTDQQKILFRALAGELVGVCFYVFIGCMATPHPEGVDPGTKHPGAGAIPVALAHGLGLAFLSAALLKISGAHLNPVVTLGVVLCGEMGLGAGLAYVATQTVAGVIGASLCRAILPENVYIGINGGAHVLHVGPGQGVLCEAVLTCAVVLTYILAVVDPNTKSDRGPIAIGFSVVVCTLAGVATTGGSMNPARSFGSAVAVSAYNVDVWKFHYIYWAGPVFGAAIAVLFYRFVLASPEKRLVVCGSNGYQFKTAKLSQMTSFPQSGQLN
ncbi:aquaporin-8-like isoform X1 [Haliotis rubra]|uniref:aquaporin-8-like isoform X1 n=1 Tax=Haliotis rubra TaxID=36100 RepID=UPI001EE62B5C|nr:aquaporin-8-like isoform X1 [Haliotis rubra]